MPVRAADEAKGYKAEEACNLLWIAALYSGYGGPHMYGSSSLTEHLIRGGVGITMFTLAAFTAADSPLLAVALALGALVPLRGCPACWTVGLYETACKRKPDINRTSETPHT
jgi:hypothetical protein